MFFLVFTACQEESEIAGLGKTTRPPQEIPDDFADQPGGLAYPSIIKQTFIPEYSLFDDEKCIAWRIEWPLYDGSVDPDQIPGFFATSKGALNSFDYLQSIDPANKQKLNFSLYLDNKLEAVTNISYLWKFGEAVNVQNVTFRQLDLEPSEIEVYVTERPALFENNWAYADDMGAEVEYQEGDFFLYKLHTDDLYGGVRIVSEVPRIIEVYLAVPNN